MSISPASTRTLRSACIGAAMLGLGLTAWSVHQVLSNYTSYSRYMPRWGWQERVYWTATFMATTAGVLAGPVVCWNSPRNRVGWMLTAVGLVWAPFFGAWYSASHLGIWYFWISPSLAGTGLLVAIIAWPTGRVERRWARPIWLVAGIWAVSVMAVFVGQNALGDPPFGWSSWGIPTVGSRSLGVTVHSTVAIVGRTLHMVLLVTMVRRHRRLPALVRRRARPVLWAAITLYGSSIWVFVSYYVAGPLEFQNGRSTIVGVIRTVVDYCAVGVATTLMACAAFARARDRLASNETVNLDSNPENIHSGLDLGSLLDDPTARLQFRRTDGTWIATTGTPAGPLGPDRRRFEIARDDETVVAGIEFAADLPVRAATFEAIAGRVQLDLLQTRRTAEAGARLLELRAMQRSVLDAQDDARLRLERDLHDGSQQRLIGLLLNAGLLARRAEQGTSTNGEIGQLADELDTAAEDIRRTVMEAQPSVLGRGLSTALHVLASGCPLPIELLCNGDLDADDPLSAPLWMIVNEAVTNALKHAAPSKISIDLHVGTDTVDLQVTDDGGGGLSYVPLAIVNRIEQVHGTATVTSPAGQGTIITVTAPTARLRAVR